MDEAAMPAVSNAVGAEGEGSEGEGSEGQRGGPEERWSQDDHRLAAEASDPDAPGWPLGVSPGYLEPGYSMRDTYVTTVEEPYLESCGYNSGDAVDPGMMMVGYQAKDPDCASDAWVVQTPVTGGAGVAGTLGVLLQAL